MRLNEICAKGKSTLRQKDLMNDGPYPVYGASGVVGSMAEYQNASPYVAIVKDGAGVGRVYACDAKSSVLGTMQALIPNEQTERNYLFHLIRFLKLGSEFSGSTIPHIYFKDYGKKVVPLPALTEQIEIANQLDYIESVIIQAQTQIEQLNTLVKSRFAEMFEATTTNQTVPMGNLLSGIVSGTNVGGNQRPLADGEYAVLKISAVTQGRFKADEYKVVDNVDGIKMIHPRKGDLLFSRANTSEMVGATAIVDKDCDNLFLPDKLWRIDPAPNVETIFLKYLLSSSKLRREISKVATGTSGSMQNISMRKFRQLPAFLPPLSLQREFSDFVQQVDKSKSIARKQIEKLQMLYDSLAQEYFGD